MNTGIEKDILLAIVDAVIETRCTATPIKKNVAINNTPNNKDQGIHAFTSTKPADKS